MSCSALNTVITLVVSGFILSLHNLGTDVCQSYIFNDLNHRHIASEVCQTTDLNKYVDILLLFIVKITTYFENCDIYYIYFQYNFTYIGKLSSVI